MELGFSHIGRRFLFGIFAAVLNVSAESFTDPESREKRELGEESCSDKTTVDIISRSEIEQMSARTLLDILQRVPSCEVTQTSNSHYRISLRGIRGKARIALLIDGRVVNDVYSGQAFWQIPADVIERVEIIQNLGTVSWGIYSIQGGVNVISRKKEGIEGSVRFGNYGLSAYTGAVGHQGQVWSGYLSGSLWADRFIPSHPQVLLGVMGSGERKLASLQEGRLYTNAFLQLENKPLIRPHNIIWGLNNGFSFKFRQKDFLGFQFFVSQNSDRQSALLKGFEEGGSSLSSLQSWTGYQTLNWVGEINSQFHFFSHHTLSVGLKGEGYGVIKNSFFYQITRSTKNEDNSLLPLPEIKLFQNEPCSLGGASSSLLGACRLVLSIFAEDEWKIGDTLKLVLGGRFVGSTISQKNFSGTLLPHFSLVFFPNKQWEIRFTYGDSLRFPTLEELYDQTSRAVVEVLPGGFLGNDNLLPEKSSNWDAKLSYNKTLSGIYFHVSGTFYYSKIRQSMERVEHQGDINVRRNYGGYDILGIEGRLKVGWGRHYIYANSGWMRGYWKEMDELGLSTCRAFFFDPVGNKPPCLLVTNIPQLIANIGIYAEVPLLGNLMMWSHFVSERRNNMRSDAEKSKPFQLPPYAILNLSYHTPKFFRFLVFNLAIFNIFNVEIRDDFIRPNRTVGLTNREGTTFYVGFNLNC